MPVTITDVDDLPIDETADVLPLDDENESAGPQWEYREVILRDWVHHLSNIEAALSQNRDANRVRIEDAYTERLNEDGAQGWEVVSEQVLLEQGIRVLMKRRRRLV